VTGGAGFVGSHLVDALIKKGHDVTIFDNLDSQIHPNCNPPTYLNKDAEFVLGDVRSGSALLKALKGKDVVFHQAAVVGIGQSMYEIKRYVDVNTLGTANLLNIIVNKKLDIKKLIVASSMSIYGEGKYRCRNCGEISPSERRIDNLSQHRWEMICEQCENEAIPIPTDENKPLQSTSIYSITKKDQEEMCLCIGRAYNVPTVALRYFNVYGPRQSLSNPYTGVMAIFGTRLLNDNSPLIYENGLQTRDFVHVSDIVKANILCMEKEEANYQIFNVGTGKAVSVLEVANLLADKLGKNIVSVVVNKYRKGDIRHCFADTSKIQKLLDFKTEIMLTNGIYQLIEWMKTQQSIDKVDKATSELSGKGLIA